MWDQVWKGEGEGNKKQMKGKSFCSREVNNSNGQRERRLEKHL
jgi:hypothetical protein